MDLEIPGLPTVINLFALEARKSEWNILGVTKWLG